MHLIESEMKKEFRLPNFRVFFGKTLILSSEQAEAITTTSLNCFFLLKSEYKYFLFHSDFNTVLLYEHKQTNNKHNSEALFTNFKSQYNEYIYKSKAKKVNDVKILSM